MMPVQKDLEYFASRAAAERHLSKAIGDPRVAGIHAELAEAYERAAEKLDQFPAVLELVGGGR